MTPAFHPPVSCYKCVRKKNRRALSFGRLHPHHRVSRHLFIYDSLLFFCLSPEDEEAEEEKSNSMQKKKLRVFSVF